MKPIALQLYTVREAGAKDFVATLKQIADIGYKGVEFAGLHGHDPKEIRKVLDDLGLVACSSHIAMPTKENLRQIVDTESALGTKNWVAMFGPNELKTLDMCREAVAKVRQAVELVAPHGASFGYHNHWWEFKKVEDGRYPYDIMMADVPGMFSELDTYWCVFAGVDVIATINKYKSRIPLYHIKDGTLEDGVPQKAVGAGKLDFAPIIGAIDANATEWLIVENDDADIDLMEAAREGYRYLVSNGMAAGNK